MIAHIVTGLPGSGKTTISQEIAKQESTLIINTDDIRESLFPNIDTKINDFTPEQLEQVYKTATVTAHYLFSSQPSVKNIIFEGTFRESKQRQAIIDVANKLSTTISVVYVTAEDSIVEKRITERFNKGIQAANFDTYLNLKEVYEKPEKFKHIDNSFSNEVLSNKISNYLKSFKKSKTLKL